MMRNVFVKGVLGIDGLEGLAVCLAAVKSPRIIVH